MAFKRSAVRSRLSPPKEKFQDLNVLELFLLLSYKNVLKAGKWRKSAEKAESNEGAIEKLLNLVGYSLQISNFNVLVVL